MFFFVRSITSFDRVLCTGAELFADLEDHALGHIVIQIGAMLIAYLARPLARMEIVARGFEHGGDIQKGSLLLLRGMAVEQLDRVDHCLCGVGGCKAFKLRLARVLVQPAQVLPKLRGGLSSQRLEEALRADEREVVLRADKIEIALGVEVQMQRRRRLAQPLGVAVFEKDMRFEEAVRHRAEAAMQVTTSYQMGSKSL